MRTDHPELARRPFPQQHVQRLARKLLPELRGAAAGDRLCQVLTARKRLDRPQEGGFGIRHRPRGREQAHRVAAEGLQPEAQRLQLRLEVPRLGGEVGGEPDDDRGQQACRGSPEVFLKLFVEDALVGTVLVYDEELVAFFGQRAPSRGTRLPSAPSFCDPRQKREPTNSR